MSAQTELKNHLDSEGRLTQWPSKRPVQEVALDYLATKFEAGKVYSEKEVNTLLELYERGLLNRAKDGSEYWHTPKTKFV
jgi:hypothetical protein